MKLGRFGKKKETVKVNYLTESFEGEMIIKATTFVTSEVNEGSHIKFLVETVANKENAWVTLFVTDKEGYENSKSVAILEEIEELTGLEFDPTNRLCLANTVFNYKLQLVAKNGYKNFYFTKKVDKKVEKTLEQRADDLISSL